ncbi:MULTISPECIES: hypothetical protein [Virgibacillus]|uniref:Uncharacterized protein n=1 Tax=Virgibacillus massiliensis TaxID=1462526 RepID=A0A024QAY5_9BACI|nr:MULTISPECIES: hypothetical protein [Virgibacillus]EQB35759.1 hypothetical protein M948_12010 [Virgibacillus sp. CM-4]CDQ39370.1 hypothetical protein BN990_01667 [Virgibacillus massiliensis]
MRYIYVCKRVFCKYGMKESVVFMHNHPFVTQTWVGIKAEERGRKEWKK